jgi:hypothetical protein
MYIKFYAAFKLSCYCCPFPVRFLLNEYRFCFVGSICEFYETLMLSKLRTCNLCFKQKLILNIFAYPFMFCV